MKETLESNSNKTQRQETNSNINKKQSQKDIDEISSQILSQYPEGINSLLNSRKPKDNEAHCLLLMNCPSSFSNKFSSNIKQQEDELLSSVIFAKAIKTRSRIEEQSKLIELKDLLTNTHISIAENNDYYYKDLLHKVFEQFEKTFENLIDVLITKYLEKQTNPSFTYESFLLIYCSIIKYYSHLNIRIDLTASTNQILLYIYGDEEIYEHLSKYFDYELRLKPYAYLYEFSRNEIQHKTYKEYGNANLTKNNIDDEQNALLESFIEHTSPNKYFKFEQTDINNPIYWPPYIHYSSQLNSKYQTYNINDDYHECSKTCCDSCSSKFRTIDKLRLIYHILTYLSKFSYMTQHKLLDMILFNRNYISYKSKLNTSTLIPSIINPFNYANNKISINTMRNYFGESVSFYFLWLDTLTRWLLFPSIIGIILTFAYYTKERVPLVALLGQQIHMDYYDFCLILFCVIISLWLTLYTNMWKQKEKLYTYIWGMEGLEKKSPGNEEFIPNDKLLLIFGYSIPIEKSFLHKTKKFISNLVLLFMVGVVCFIIYYLFRLKASLLNGNPRHDFKIAILIASINGIQIKIMNIIYYYMAMYLNKWENHSKLINHNNSLATKLLMFDFVNSYSSLFYIAFIKPYNEGCQYDNCLKEIEMQIYTIFFIYLFLYLCDLVMPILIQYYNKKRLKDLLKISQCEPQSMEHQILSETVSTMNFEYNNAIIQFGFVCLFSVAAPLAPLIVFILLLVGRIVGYYKVINLQRITMITGAKGIEVYNKVIKGLFFIGMMVNVAIVLFSSPNLAKRDLMNGNISLWDFVQRKMLIFAGVENLILIIMTFCKWNTLPQWFKYIHTIKELYNTKIIFRET